MANQVPSALPPDPGARPSGWHLPPEMDPSWADRPWPERHWRALLAGALCTVVILVVMVAGMAALWGGPNTEARLSATAVITGDTLTISGATDLPDGTELDGQAADDTMLRSIDSDYGPATEGLAFCETTVTGGTYSCAMDISGWTAGSGSGSIGFSIDETQPQALRDRYGADGSLLSGPDVSHPDESVAYYGQGTHFGFAIP